MTPTRLQTVRTGWRLGNTMNDVYERLGMVLIAQGRVSAERLAPMATFEELGLDSLDCVTLAMALEKEFGVEVDDAELAPEASLTDTVRLLESKLNLVSDGG